MSGAGGLLHGIKFAEQWGNIWWPCTNTCLVQLLCSQDHFLFFVQKVQVWLWALHMLKQVLLGFCSTLHQSMSCKAKNHCTRQHAAGHPLLVLRKYHRCAGINCTLDWDYPGMSVFRHLEVSRADLQRKWLSAAWTAFFGLSISTSATGPVTSSFMSVWDTGVARQYKERQVAERLICRKYVREESGKSSESKYWLNAYINIQFSLFKTRGDRQAGLKQLFQQCRWGCCAGVTQTPSLLIISGDEKVIRERQGNRAQPINSTCFQEPPNDCILEIRESLSKSIKALSINMYKISVWFGWRRKEKKNPQMLGKYIKLQTVSVILSSSWPVSFSI